MKIESKDEVLAIMEYVKSTNLKGTVEIGENYFWWNLGDVELYFGLDLTETKVEYYRRKNKLLYLGHAHFENSDVLTFIRDVNDENKMLQITVTPLFFTLSVIDTTAKQKKSWFLVRRYYSI